MVTSKIPVASVPEASFLANGSAMAAFMGAGIGAFAMGLVVVVNEAGLFTVPTLYGPAGGLSGRSTLAVIAWLMAWGTLHLRWRGREVSPRRTCLLTVILIVLGIAGTFPPFWQLL